MSDDSVSSATTAEPSAHEVPKLEASLYYAGVGPKERGPRLIYRTSEDVFEAPSGPEAYKRLMRIIAVPDTSRVWLESYAGRDSGPGRGVQVTRPEEDQSHIGRFRTQISNFL